MTTNQNATQKVDSNCFKLHRSYLISFNLSNVGEIIWIESERKKKGKRKLLCGAHLLYKLGSFHVAVVQQGLRNVQKCVMYVQSCSFTKLNLLLFLLLRKLRLVVIQKFCYHSNETSHFSSLFLSKPNSNKTLQ